MSTWVYFSIFLIFRDFWGALQVRQTAPRGCPVPVPLPTGPGVIGHTTGASSFDHLCEPCSLANAGIALAGASHWSRLGVRNVRDLVRLERSVVDSLTRAYGLSDPTAKWWRYRGNRI